MMRAPYIIHEQIIFAVLAGTKIRSKIADVLGSSILQSAFKFIFCIVFVCSFQFYFL